jgi:membrane associated rhomboid family serine protease
MNSFSDQIKYQFKAGGMYLKLIYINVGIFLLLSILGIIAELMKSYEFLSFISLNTGASSDLTVLVRKPWTIITYMFVHAGFWHIFSNMLMLFFLGRMLEAYIGPKKILSIYVLGAIAGLFLQIASKHIFPLFIDLPHGLIVGASGGVFAVAAALITYNPKLEVNFFGIFPIKLIWIVGLYFLSEIMQVSKISGVAHFAHIGGGIFGYLMIRQYQNGKDITLWFDSMMSFFVNLFKSNKGKHKMKVKYSKFRDQDSKSTTPPPRDDYDYNADKAAQQEKLDKILDKIKMKGYDGLTKSEKDFLAKF